MTDKQWWEQSWFHGLLVILSALPLLYPTVPVWGDMPAHVGMYRVALEHADPRSPLNQFYHFSWKIQGNMGVDLLVTATSALLPLELATKLILVLTIIVTSTGILMLSREVHGRVSPMVLFAVPLAYTFTFQFGMANYSLSMGLAFCGFACWLKLGRLGRWQIRALMFLIFSPLLWMCHIFGWAVLCVLCGMTELGQNMRRGDSWWRAFWRAALTCLVFGAPLVLTIIWRSNGSQFASDWFDVEEKISFMLHSLSAIWPMGEVKSIIVKILLLVICGIVMSRQKSCRVHPKMRPGLGMLALLFLLLPTTLFSSYGADGRLFPYIVILFVVSLVISGGSELGKEERFAKFGLGFAILQIVALTISFARTGEAQEGRLQVLRQLPVGARLASFVGTGPYCDDHEYNRVMNHLPSMALVRRRAFANDQFQNDQLMRVAYPDNVPASQIETEGAGRDYYHDESQLVSNLNCKRSIIDTKIIDFLQHSTESGAAAKPQDLRSIDYTLRHLPRDRFDYVWLVATPPFDPALLKGLTLVAQAGDSMLYRITRPQ